MMKIAATASLAAGPDAPILYRGPYETVLPRIRQDGFDAVELHILDSRAIDRGQLHRLLRDNGLTLTSIGTGSIYGKARYNLADRDEAVRRAAIAHLEEHMKTLAPAGGVLIIGLIAGRLSDSGLPMEAHRARLGESLRELDHLAGQYGVTVGLEMMNRYECDFLYTVQEGLDFLDEVGGLTHTGLHVDAVSMNISERDVAEAIRAGRGRICHVHLADNDRWYPGHAHFDFRAMLQALNDIGYTGALALEQKPYPDPHTSARLSLTYLSALLALIHPQERV